MRKKIAGAFVSSEPSHSLTARMRYDPRLATLTDALAAAVAVALPWSTSLTVAFVWLYLASLLPRLTIPELGRAFREPVSAVSSALLVLGALGMLWADVAMRERLGGLGGFRFVLFIPALILHFRHSANAHWVLAGFLASCSVLMVLSWTLHLFPNIPWTRPVLNPDVPVKDHITQSMEFTVCIFVLAALAAGAWKARRNWLALSLIVLALAFLSNIFYVATSRTALVALPILLLLFGIRQFPRRGLLMLLGGAVVVITLVWLSSPYLRERVTRVIDDVNNYSTNFNTAVGLRLEFWRKSAQLVSEAPVIGHGTGSIRELFRQQASGGNPDNAVITNNPHNQILTVALQLGAVGVLVLFVMWCTHLAAFRGPGLAAWIGLLVVVQNMIASLFNSSLFDFTQGLGYALGVGMASAVMLRRADAALHATPDLATPSPPGYRQPAR
jgi:hypothetical protein